MAVVSIDFSNRIAMLDPNESMMPLYTVYPPRWRQLFHHWKTGEWLPVRRGMIHHNRGWVPPGVMCEQAKPDTSRLEWLTG